LNIRKKQKLNVFSSKFFLLVPNNGKLNGTSESEGQMPSESSRIKISEKRHDVIKMLLAFISPMNRKFISKIARGDSFLV
jgi:hypothetical protein